MQPTPTHGGPTSKTRKGPGLAAAVALAGAGVIAAHPAVSPAPASAQLSGMRLMAAQDITWDEVFQSARTGATDISNHFSAVPFPALQQVLANQIGYVQGLLNGSVSFSDVSAEIQNHLTAVFGAPATDTTAAIPGALFGPFLPEGGATDTLYQSLDATVNSTGTGIFAFITLNHEQLFPLLADAIPSLLPALGLDESALPQIDSLLQFAGSPLGGIVIGELGTALSPMLQLNDDISSITTALSDSDWNAALQDLANMPANLASAYLNGYGEVDLMPILDQLGIDLPPVELVTGLPTTVTDLNVVLGGLLSGGGSLFDAIGLSADGGESIGALDLSGLAVGPLASMVELSQAIAEALGWDGSSDILASPF